MKRSQGLGALLLLAVAATTLAILGGGGQEGPEESLGVAPEAAVTAAEPDASLSEAAAPAPSTRMEAQAPEEAPGGGADTPEIEGPSCRILGRVADESGAPVADAAVQLYTVGEVWADGVERGRFKTRTDAAGAFELVTPLPTSTWISLNISPGPFLSLAGREFGAAGGRNQPPLLEGDNDLGVFTLLATGAIGGYVRSEDARPLEKARVSLDGSFPGGRVLGAYLDPSGRYVIEHVPPGYHDIKVKADGYLVARSLGIDVVAGSVTDGQDLTLLPAPQISGRVVDEAGSPLEGVKVGGFPFLGSGSSARDRTDSDGRFVLDLPHAEAYRITASLAGYQTWGEEDGQRGNRLEPGETDVVIVLVGMQETTFVVVDAGSGEPIERFGLSLEKASRTSWDSGGDSRAPKLADVPGGEKTLPTDAENFHALVRAPGYAPLTCKIKHDEGGLPRQTVRLERESRLRGRLLFQGSPVASATVQIRRCLFLKSGAPRPAEIDPFDSDATYDLDSFTGRRRRASTDEAGVFEFGELAEGTYSLVVTPIAGAPIELEELRVPAGGLLDLGDLVQAQGGSVRGRVILAGGVTVTGLELRLADGGPRRQKTTVDADGEFELTGIKAGEHALRVRRLDGVLLQSKPFPFQVVDGQVTELDLDLRPFQVGRVRARVTEAGNPRPGVLVNLLDTEGEWYRSDNVTDELGEVMVDARAGRSIERVMAMEPHSLSLGAARGSWSAAAGSEISIGLEISSSELTLSFPSDHELPEDGVARVTYGDATIKGPSRRPATWSTREQDQHNGMAHPWAGGDLVVGPVASGRHQVRVVVDRYATNEASRREHQAQERWTATAELEPGSSGRVLLQRELD